MPMKIGMESSAMMMRVMAELLESERSCGVVDLSTGLQRAVSTDCVMESSGLFFAGISADDALSIKRSDLWLPRDLELFNDEWPKVLTPNDPGSTLEWSWRGKMPGGRKLKKVCDKVSTDSGSGWQTVSCLRGDRLGGFGE